MKSTLLLVEDDAALRISLRRTLQALEVEVHASQSGEEALEYLIDEAGLCDVVLLDLNMPGMGGLAACRRIREKRPLLAIIVLTVRDQEEDKVMALNAGADDYVTKPFALGELFARVRAALRRAQLVKGDQDAAIEAGGIRIEPSQRRVVKDGKPVHLTPKEFDLLLLLMRHLGRPLGHQLLLSSIWGAEYGNEREYLRTYMNQLRRKLEDDPASPRYLLTENYIGYRFADNSA
jgi:two-component system, OmpR family, KDP operon response regulator KdpE